jgi:hypothetical protein
MATYNKNQMLPQRKDALNRWAQFVEDLFKSELNKGGRQFAPTLSTDTVK